MSQVAVLRSQMARMRAQMVGAEMDEDGEMFDDDGNLVHGGGSPRKGRLNESALMESKREKEAYETVISKLRAELEEEAETRRRLIGDLGEARKDQAVAASMQVSKRMLEGGGGCRHLTPTPSPLLSLDCRGTWTPRDTRRGSWRRTSPTWRSRSPKRGGASLTPSPCPPRPRGASAGSTTTARCSWRS